MVLVRGPRQDLEVEEASRVSVEILEKEKHKLFSQCPNVDSESSTLILLKLGDKNECEDGYPDEDHPDLC